MNKPPKRYILRHVRFKIDDFLTKVAFFRGFDQGKMLSVGHTCLVLI